jgi:hypothetical protein
MAEYRIEYTIQRDDGDDFRDIGFGSSGTWGGIDAALYAVETEVQRREWEIEGDMPDPSTVDATPEGPA